MVAAPIRLGKMWIQGEAISIPQFSRNHARLMRRDAALAQRTFGSKCWVAPLRTAQFGYFGNPRQRSFRLRASRCQGTTYLLQRVTYITIRPLQNLSLCKLGNSSSTTLGNSMGKNTAEKAAEKPATSSTERFKRLMSTSGTTKAKGKSPLQINPEISKPTGKSAKEDEELFALLARASEDVGARLAEQEEKTRGLAGAVKVMQE